MTKKNTLADCAEKMYIVDQMTINEIANQLNIHEKSVRNWKEEFNWDNKRKQLLSSKTMFHEELYNFARKLMESIEYDMARNEKVDPGRMFAFTKMLPLITKIKEYEDTIAQKQTATENKGITPDFVEMIETEILGMHKSEK